MHDEQFNWGPGKVVFWDLVLLDSLKPLASQIHQLKEDLGQVLFPGGVILDIGWYPEFSPTGNFVVRIVQNDDWDSPILEMSAKSIEDLITVVNKCVIECVHFSDGHDDVRRGALHRVDQD